MILCMKVCERPVKSIYLRAYPLIQIVSVKDALEDKVQKMNLELEQSAKRYETFRLIFEL